MPIRPENKVKYPPPKVWREMREWLLARFGNCCAECGVENRKWISRARADASHYRYESDDCGGVHVSTDPEHFRRPVEVVLTIAHLDHDPENSDDDNLRPLCQRCHNLHDADHRRANAQRTRRLKAGPELPCFTL